MLKLGDNVLDSDNEDEESLDSNNDHEAQMKLEEVRMILDGRSFIYYVQQKNGKCYIMEGNPRDPKIRNHYSIFSLKANKCLAFSAKNQDTFFFMDD